MMDEQMQRDRDARENIYGTEQARLSAMREHALGPSFEEETERVEAGVKSMTRWSRGQALLLAAIVAGLTEHPLAFPAALVVYLLFRLIDVVAIGSPSYRQQIYSSTVSQELALRNILVEVRKLAGPPSSLIPRDDSRVDDVTAWASGVPSVPTGTPPSPQAPKDPAW